ncbi:MAG TPA: vanadium-dependent haloperoxidase, partial [Xanthomonadales bacterium]|nr:vanadium-dependent haloperoxidase [Xanthomonadales bacterium]
LDFFEDQGGNVIVGGYPGFLSPEWGRVTPFALQPEDLTIYQRDGQEYWVYHDPGPPPQLGGVGDAQYKAGFEQVVLWSGLLDPADGPGGGALIDISPASRGDNPLGSNAGNGHAQNPVTGLPYAPQLVPAGDYYRVLAEFWSDGPESETPPGHWFTIANHVSDHPQFQKRFRGEGPVLDELEWDVKLYLTLGGTMHDVAVSAWGIKGWYDYTRPISAIRHMCDLGQSSDPLGPSYHPQGIGLYPGYIEVITEETAAVGGRHFPLGGNIFQHVGKIAVRAWRGPDYIPDPATDKAGVGWIRCENWWPYQRPTFVTPPFAGYVSGHSTFSRAAATILAEFTGSKFFPGGLGEFEAPQNEFLVFEEGPSVDITLQWATYFDAADETSLSRIYGGIHPAQDDIPGRFIGAEIGQQSFEFASSLFGVSADPERAIFKVSKYFLGGDESDKARVTIACNTGLVLEPERELADGESAEFVVSSFADGALDCTIIELADAGYVAEYRNVTADSVSTSGCDYPAVAAGDRLECEITNTVFFENIPAVNRFGVAVLALLLLTAGLLGFRHIHTV